MFLRVTPKATFWGFDNIWMTFDDSEPHDIDLENISQETRNAIELALKRRILVEVDKDNNPVKELKFKPVIQKPIVKAEQNETSADLDIDPLMKESIKKLLKGNITSIRREVALVKNSFALSAAIGLEKKGKNRKTVIRLLGKRLTKIAGSSPPLQGTRNIYDNLITEEEGETIEIDLRDLIVQETYEEKDSDIVNG